MNKITKKLFEVINFNIKEENAFNIRENGKASKRQNTSNISITSKSDKNGIDINIKENTKNEEVFIPVVVYENMHDLVYNDFYINEGSEVTIHAACLLHNENEDMQGHEGIHRFFVSKNAKVKYIEQHYGENKTHNTKIDTVTEIYLEDFSTFEIETSQIGGVNKSKRTTKAVLKDNSTLIVNEKMKTNDNDYVTSSFSINLIGANSKATIESKSVAAGFSKQEFITDLIGENKSFGHIRCDAILIDNAEVSSTPKITAKDSDSVLTHEAAIGKIAEEGIIKLMTLGLDEEEAQSKIIEGFLN